MESKLIYKNSTKLIRIDAEIHRLLKVKASRSKMTIKELVETYLANLLAVDNKQTK